jgi:hypothetical protein
MNPKPPTVFLAYQSNVDGREEWVLGVFTSKEEARKVVARQVMHPNEIDRMVREVPLYALATVYEADAAKERAAYKAAQAKHKAEMAVLDAKDKARKTWEAAKRKEFEAQLAASGPK